MDRAFLFRPENKIWKILFNKQKNDEKVNIRFENMMIWDMQPFSLVLGRGNLLNLYLINYLIKSGIQTHYAVS